MNNGGISDVATLDATLMIYIGRLMDDKGAQITFKGLSILPLDIDYQFSMCKKDNVK